MHVGTQTASQFMQQQQQQQQQHTRTRRTRRNTRRLEAGTQTLEVRVHRQQGIHGTDINTRAGREMSQRSFTRAAALGATAAQRETRRKHSTPAASCHVPGHDPGRPAGFFLAIIVCMLAPTALSVHLMLLKNAPSATRRTPANELCSSVVWTSQQGSRRGASLVKAMPKGLHR